MAYRRCVDLLVLGCEEHAGDADKLQLRARDVLDAEEAVYAGHAQEERVRHQLELLHAHSSGIRTELRLKVHSMLLSRLKRPPQGTGRSALERWAGHT